MVSQSRAVQETGMAQQMGRKGVLYFIVTSTDTGVHIDR